ncbi:MAG: hypothetical protein BM557_05480 [Flavobacterium sp. MedPE-SWcel]|mgnify:CR=1 FL=1|uniref:SRPBCC family protein n=1 Tax=uncultured Flavobacterium sp. TaxID=165435 RepID=UPI0009195804|nr:SRPBCC domain-containing protein [uncultured Flavobacterium sp.]OIQ20123.1 MAG: hypothetical protein BM557_05480 [Flavobacterium sp. MedPE-SWcel]
MNDTISKEIILKKEIESVWNAITKQEELSTWFIKADFKAEEGYNYKFTSLNGDCDDVIRGVVKKATPYTLVYTWIIEGFENVETLVEWNLESISEGTRLTVKHSGISKYQGENAAKMFENFSGGWDNCVLELSKYL